MYTTNATMASQYGLLNYSFDIKVYNGRPIEIVKADGKININLPTANDLPSELAYNTRGNDVGIDSFFKIYLKTDLTLTSTLPTINGKQVEYNASKKKLSLENFVNIILTSHPEDDAVYTILSQTSIPDIDYVELQMKSTTTSDLVIVTDDYNVANRNGYQW